MLAGMRSSSEFSTEASLKYFILGHLAQLFYYLESVLYTGVLVRFILLTLAYFKTTITLLRQV
jgi:NADH:ubiquinone oxidoreductase subunit 2 (subunit N)